MVITGKVVHEVDINWSGNFHHQFFNHKPEEMAAISPDIVRNCCLISGQWGTSGSVISWNFILDGKMSSIKVVVEIDDEKIVFKAIEGDALQVYNALSLIVQTEKIGDKQLCIWSVDFQKPNINIPDPTKYLDVVCGFTKDLNAYNLKCVVA